MEVSRGKETFAGKENEGEKGGGGVGMIGILKMQIHMESIAAGFFVHAFYFTEMSEESMKVRAGSGAEKGR